LPAQSGFDIPGKVVRRKPWQKGNTPIGKANYEFQGMAAKAQRPNNSAQRINACSDEIYIRSRFCFTDLRADPSPAVVSVGGSATASLQLTIQ
jgi:hypothetical protein